MTGALDGIRVIDLTQNLAGPFCSMNLADHGADVIKVEPPGGDGTRQVAPFLGGESTPFMMWNRNKRSLVLDLKTEDDRAALLGLLERADILMEAFRPGAMDRLGLGWEALTRISHTDRRIGAPNQRKLLCCNDFLRFKKEPRCRQSVARNALILEPLKVGLWKPPLMPAW